jgi:hypothetical protein
VETLQTALDDLECGLEGAGEEAEPPVTLKREGRRKSTRTKKKKSSSPHNNTRGVRRGDRRWL